MNPFTAQTHSAALAQRYRQEAETARLLALAPRRDAGRPTVARALRSLAQQLSTYADRLERTTARFARRGQAAAQHHVR